MTYSHSFFEMLVKSLRKLFLKNSSNMYKSTPTPTSKKSQKSSAVIHLQCWSVCESLVSREKKECLLQGASSQASRGIFKDIPKEKLVYRWNRKPDADVPPILRAINAESALRFALAASAMLESACCGAMWGCFACSAHLQRNDEGLHLRRLVWKQTPELFTERTRHHHGQRGVSQKRSLASNRKKILAEIDFSADVFAWIQSYWAQVERFEAKGCWLCSSIWLHFTGYWCCFKRQLAIYIHVTLFNFFVVIKIFSKTRNLGYLRTHEKISKN